MIALTRILDEPVRCCRTAGNPRGARADPPLTGLGDLLLDPYQQAPVPAEGNIVKREWLRFYEDLPASFDFTVASWDTASTLSDSADNSVGKMWGAKGRDFEPVMGFESDAILINDANE
jgi:hypothetical protein